MGQQPDDTERSRKIDDGRDGEGSSSDRRPQAPAPFEEPRRDDARFGDSATTTEPLWVLVSIVLALIALSGSILAFCLTVVVGLLVWLAHTPPEEGSQQRRNPFGGPIIGPGIWP
jgi:hypothetical protein